MSVIIQLQNLPISASSLDIRSFFNGLTVPPGGVHIVGGKKGVAFIAFVSDEDARLAMERNGCRIKDARIKLALSSHRELKEVLEKLHKEQLSDYEASRKMRMSESKQEGGRSRQKRKLSRSRSRERNRDRRECPDTHKSRGRFEDLAQRENMHIKEQSPYDRHTERKIHYNESYNQELLSTSGIDKPNPYISSSYGSHTEDDRNEEIRKRIESFIAAFGQTDKYSSFEANSDPYVRQPKKVESHDSYSGNLFSPSGVKESMLHNRMHPSPSGQIPMESYQSKIFDDFDSRRHFEDQNIVNELSTSGGALQGSPISSMGAQHSFQEQERNMHGGQNLNFGKSNQNYSEDRMLNSPMDIEEDKNIQPDPCLGPQFNTLEEMSNLHGGSRPPPVDTTAWNVAPFSRFENPAGDLELGIFERSQNEITSCNIEAAKDLCIKLVGLPYYASESDIRSVFQGASIFDLFIQYTSDGKATGCGFVQFSSAEDLDRAIKMRYCMIGDSRVDFYGSSRGELMEARMPVNNAVTNIGPGVSFIDVLAVKRNQDILSSMISTQEHAVPSSYPPFSSSFSSLPTSCAATVPTSKQQPTKRSLCAVITGFPSHFTRHIQVLRCIEDVGINFHLIHLVLNNRARFTGKVFAEFQNLHDLDAALQKHNESVEGCTIGVRQVLPEEMMKFLDSHRSRCMYPSLKELPLEEKPEKAPYIWEPPYAALDRLTDRGSYRRGKRGTPAVWSTERDRENQREVARNDLHSHMNEETLWGNSNRIETFNSGFKVPNVQNDLYGNRTTLDVQTNRSKFPNVDLHDRVNAAEVNLRGGVRSASNHPEASNSFYRNRDGDSPGRERNFGSSRPREDRGFTPRGKASYSSPYSRDQQCGYSPTRKRDNSLSDHNVKRFRNEKDHENDEIKLPASHTRHVHHQENRYDISSTDRVVERKEEDPKKHSSQSMVRTKTDVSSTQKNGANMKGVREISVVVRKRSEENISQQKSFPRTCDLVDQCSKAKHEKEHAPLGKGLSPKSQKKRIEHRRNCPKRQKVQPVDPGSRTDDCSKLDDHSRIDTHSRPNSDRSRVGNPTRSSDYSKADDHTRLNDYSKVEDSTRLNNYSKVDDHLKPSDSSRHQSRLDDCSRVNDHSRPNQSRLDDRSRVNDHSRLDDHSRANDRSRPDQSSLDDHSRVNDRSRTDKSRVDDRSRVNDRSRPDQSRVNHRSRPDQSRVNDRSRPDQSRLDDHSRVNDRSRLDQSRLDDHSRVKDHSRLDQSRLDDHSRVGDRSGRGNRSRPDRSKTDHSRHRDDQKEFKQGTSDVCRTENPFDHPGSVLEATNVDPRVGLYELLDFFRGYNLQSDNLIRRYTDTGEPTGDLRIAFRCPADAKQAFKILNLQYLKGKSVILSFV